MKNFYFNCTGKHAGLISFGFDMKTSYERNYNFHFFVRRSHQQWGFDRIDANQSDFPYSSFGLGPLFLVAWV